MQKKLAKKLMLSKEILRRLNGRELGNAIGGKPIITSDNNESAMCTIPPGSGEIRCIGG